VRKITKIRNERKIAEWEFKVCRQIFAIFRPPLKRRRREMNRMRRGAFGLLFAMPCLKGGRNAQGAGDECGYAQHAV
jgi:hypothetical protein